MQASEGTIEQFATAFNKGDMKTAKALHTAAPVIIDEVAPHLWSGGNAFDGWGADLAKSDAAQGAGRGGQGDTSARPPAKWCRAITPMWWRPRPTVSSQAGAAMHETVQITFVLDKEASGWKIASWTWTGPKPSR